VPVQLCPPPPQIPNAQDMKTTVNYQDGEKVSVLCQEGYLIQEAEEMVCKDGKWQSLPRCVEISCELPEIRNGFSLSQKTTFRENERLQYKCHSGFVYRERGDAICTASGWSPSPFCEGNLLFILLILL
ncbi:complement factor H-like, partial [Tupaia chinensis]|uniref:complement factor H-like n=1 Tax=Tupaia chinensis TaxID=246437 RepID=UPI000FFB314C